MFLKIGIIIDIKNYFINNIMIFIIVNTCSITAFYSKEIVFCGYVINISFDGNEKYNFIKYCCMNTIRCLETNIHILVKINIFHLLHFIFRIFYKNYNVFKIKI